MIHKLLPAVLSLTAAPMLAAANGDSAPCRFDDGRSAVRYAVTSFGAEGVGADLYVFSGHVGRTHAHSQANLDPHFIRYSCDGTVEELPSGGAVQGTALVGFGSDVIAVGGLTARNATPDEAEDLVSIATVRRFDHAQRQWIDLPDLPQARSSHDAVVLQGRLYVVGGWQLRGADRDPVWISEMAFLDLETEGAAWQVVAQPFLTRALAVTHDGERLVVTGGMTDDEKTTAATHLYDIQTDTWEQGPDLPTPRGLKGFGLAAESLDGRALVSPAGGEVFALVGDGPHQTWKSVAQLDEPRFFHELAVVDGHLHAVAGTSRRSHLDSVEAVTVDPTSLEAPAPTTPASAPGRTTGWAGFRHGAHRTDEPGSRFSERWRTELPGYGQSSPVIWADQQRRVYLTTTEGTEMETQHLLGIDLDTGDIVWKRSVEASERFENSDMIARAASTPAVDVDRVYALFGSGDLIATNHDGDLLWQRDLVSDHGSFGGNHGVGSSVVRTTDAVVVSVARKTYAYVLALDPATGATRWKTERKPGPGWTTPVHLTDRVLLVGGSGRLDAIDTSSGDLLWTVEGLGGNNVSSPTVRWLEGEDSDSTFQIAVAATRSGGVSLLAGTDPREAPGILWQNDQSSHYSAPVFHGDCLLTSNGVGGLFCFDHATGEEKWRERLAGPVWATALATADGSVLLTSEKGTIQQLAADTPTVRTLGTVELGGRTYGVDAADAWLVLRNGSTVIGLTSDDGP